MGARSGLGTVSAIVEESFDGEYAGYKMLHTFDSGLRMIVIEKVEVGSPDQPTLQVPLWNTSGDELTMAFYDASYVSFSFEQPVNAVYFNGFGSMSRFDKVSLRGTVTEEIYFGEGPTKEVFSFRYGPGTWYNPGDGWESWKFGIVSNTAFEQVTFLFEPHDSLVVGLYSIDAWAVEAEPPILPGTSGPDAQIPLPTTVGLLGSGIASLVLWRRRNGQNTDLHAA